MLARKFLNQSLQLLLLFFDKILFKAEGASHLLNSLLVLLVPLAELLHLSLKVLLKDLAELASVLLRMKSGFVAVVEVNLLGTLRDCFEIV